jgi:hypothetical protein
MSRYSAGILFVALLFLPEAAWACQIQAVFSSDFTQQEKDCALAAISEWQCAIQNNFTFANLQFDIGTDTPGLAGTQMNWVGDGPAPSPWWPGVSMEIQLSANYISQISFDATGPVPSNMYDGLSIFRHELCHALGFDEWYDAFNLHLGTDAAGARTYHAFAGFSVGITPQGQGTHMDDSNYPDDLMVAGLPPGVRRPISAIDLAVLSDAYPYTTGTVYAFGDVNHDGVVNAADIDAIYRNFGGGSQYDLNDDGVVDQADVTFELQQIFHTSYGDADLNGNTDFVDFQALLTHWQASGPLVGWADGDFNGDGTVDFLDFQILLNYWNPGGWNFAPSQVPEPGTWVLLGLGGMAIIRRRALRARQKVAWASCP